MSHAQKALLIESKQGPFVLGTRPIPTPGAGEVVVKVHAAGLNPVDWKIQAYGIFVEDFPAVVGSDVAGEIEAVGQGVEGFQKGDRVFLQGPFTDNKNGAFQQYMVNPAELTAKIPANLSYSEAATIPVAFNCAAFGLFAPAPLVGTQNFPDIWSGEGALVIYHIAIYAWPAVVIGGSSSVGQYVIQLLKLAGFSPIIAYASTRHAAHLTSLGATHVLDRTNTLLTPAALHAAVQAITSAPISIVFDAVCSADAQQSGYAVLGPGGTIVIAGRSLIEAAPERTVVPVLGSEHPPTHRAFGRVVVANITGMVADGRIVPNRVEEVPGGLAGIKEGLAKLQRGEVSGVKLVGHPLEA
ncbi:chaperonin 10-like protein [Mycena rosella]|uniref:Chaperonin 10-like protein n=1 Tax=Mycena rosella TaxID=1033263 RepID=A0AAD7GC20_MYCRO|nr:chaperonin 10-like protein [Mycena rosella]